jgi:Na+-transporting methylmalonyl-CoA/oxaloacetate decarboxylase beta subunit
MDLLIQFLTNTGFYLADYRNIIMIVIGSVFLYLGTAKRYEPLLLIPIGFGILVGNVPFFKGFGLGIYENNSVLHYLYFGVTTGLYPSIVFLGLGAMTDFSSLLARPKLMLLGAAAQMGIFLPWSAPWPWAFCQRKQRP